MKFIVKKQLANLFQIKLLKLGFLFSILPALLFSQQMFVVCLLFLLLFDIVPSEIEHDGILFSLFCVQNN